MSTALIVGVVLAVLSLGYVLLPLVGGGRLRRGPIAAERRRAATPISDEEIEAAISAYRAAHVVGDVCANCGPRPESDAVFCSSCGRRLVDSSATH